jgi:hypothetical protein
MNPDSAQFHNMASNLDFAGKLTGHNIWGSCLIDTKAHLNYTPLPKEQISSRNPPIVFSLNSAGGINEVPKMPD